MISIHALLAESDALLLMAHPVGRKFLSTLSLRRATDVPVMSLTEYGLFLSTLSLRRATDMAVSYSKGIKISIHALLAESDGLCQSW